MISSWLALPKDKRRTWTTIAGLIVAGSALKVVYFTQSRGLMMEDIDRKHQSSLERLQETRKYADWAQKDRQERLQPLTPAQRQQLGDYLSVLEGQANKQAVASFRDQQSSGDPRRMKILGIDKTAASDRAQK